VNIRHYHPRGQTSAPAGWPYFRTSLERRDASRPLFHVKQASLPRRQPDSTEPLSVWVLTLACWAPAYVPRET